MSIIKQTQSFNLKSHLFSSLFSDKDDTFRDDFLFKNKKMFCVLILIQLNALSCLMSLRMRLIKCLVNFQLTADD